MLALAEALELHLERIRDGHLLSRLGATVVNAFGQNDRKRAVQLARSTAARQLEAADLGTAPARIDRHRTLVVVAKAESRAGNAAQAEAALAEARALHDSTWPPARQVLLAEAELFAARARGDEPAALRLARQMLALEQACGERDSISVANVVDAELAAGEPARAAEVGSALVAALAGGRNVIGLAFARVNLAAALLVLGRCDEARGHLEPGWQAAPLFDMQPYYADYLANLCALAGRAEAAARIAGYADAANARIGPREPNEAAAIARATGMARAALGDAEFDRLHAEGASLGDVDITALAFGSDEAR